MTHRREGKSMFNIMLERSHAMHWAKGYMVAISDILKKKDEAIEYGLEGDEIAHFMSGEAKAMRAAVLEKYETLEKQFHKSGREKVKAEFDTEPK